MPAKARYGTTPLKPFAAERHKHQQERDNQHAEHVKASHHRRIERYRAHARVHERRAAVDRRQPRAAPGAGRRVAQQRHGDGRDRIEPQRRQKRRGDRRRRACARRPLEEDGQHHADDHSLHAAVVADAGDGRLYVLDRAGFAQKVQNHKRAENHPDDLQAFLQAFPDKRVENVHRLLKGRAVDVEERKAQHKRPYERRGRDAFRRLLKRENSDQHNKNRAERHYKIYNLHLRSFLSCSFLPSRSPLPAGRRKAWILSKKRPRRNRRSRLSFPSAV